MSNPVYRLLLVDPDPVFRLGLRAWLDSLPNLDLAAETGTAEQALQILAGTAALENPQTSRSRTPALKIDLVILGFSLGQDPLNAASALKLCQQVKAQYPAVPILILGFPQDGTGLPSSLKGYIKGYCLKGQSPEELVTAIQQVASGHTYWSDLNQNRNSLTQPSALVERPVSVWAVVKQNLYWSGLRHIDAALGDLEAEYQHFSPSTADSIAKAILAGRMRELSAARWFRKSLVATPRNAIARSF
ncbi:MAG: response regulator transcription factor [Acaryochloridaceae cyanobacterium RU_4_10]|nr:response regulator transcription factor [Acaryochloridaceae cyanobacterium RU_4_10]